MNKSQNNIISSYKHYKVDNKAKIKIVSKSDYNLILQLFFKFLSNKIIQGVDIRLPFGIGMLGVRGCKPKLTIDDNNNIKNITPDWKATKELWETNEKAKLEKYVVPNSNEHSDGIRYKLKWFKRNSLILNKNVYTFRLSRENKRKISKEISINNKEYVNL